MTSFSWTPILSGDTADRAMDAVAAIVRDPRMRASENGDTDDAAGGASLAGGTAGRALLYAYLAACDLDEAASGVAVEQLESSLTALEDVRMSASLHEGIAGIAWTHAHLAGRMF